MRKTEMLWFDDVSPLNEPVLAFPVIGRLSMRQFFILGLASVISYEVFMDTHSPASAISACIGALLAFARPNVGSTEWMMLSMMMFLAGGRRQAALWRKLRGTRSGASGNLGLASSLVAKEGTATALLRVLGSLRARRDGVHEKHRVSQA